MSNLFIILIFSAIICITTPVYGQQCGANETFLQCGCNATCFDQNPVCNQTNCMPGCFCNTGLLRSFDGSCITPDVCQIFASGVPTGGVLNDTTNMTAIPVVISANPVPIPNPVPIYATATASASATATSTSSCAPTSSLDLDEIREEARDLYEEIFGHFHCHHHHHHDEPKVEIEETDCGTVFKISINYRGKHYKLRVKVPV